MLRYVSGQRDALQASRAAEARAAAAAERGRLAREMHDVLAHSLSALALQLETTRLLARDRGVEDQITQAIDRAHRLATASDGEEALALTDEHKPDVVLMDLRMPRLGGIEATRRLRERQPDIHVIALTTYADDESVLGALRAGARGYLTKDASSNDIRNAILTVAAGEAALDPSVHHHVVAALASDGERAADPCASTGVELPDDLTPREAEVLALIAEGLTNI